MTDTSFIKISELDRRRFLGATGSAFAALLAGACAPRGAVQSGAVPYGALAPDPAGILDLPPGFSYRVISKLGDPMADGLTVPDAADGMGCFALPGGKLALVRNHELSPGHDPGGALTSGYGRMPNGDILPGGTTTIVLDARTLEVERQHRSLAGTIRNCAGGETPWGSWLTCEEPGGSGLKAAKTHGYVFEVPAAATGLVDPMPLKAMGRFNHEAVAIDPASGIAYMTEDRDDGLFYRFIPNVPGKFEQGGELEVLAMVDGPANTRNWDEPAFPRSQAFAVRWIPLDNVEAPEDDLRLRGGAAGAAIFARGEGVHMGEGELYFCCTSGGAKKIGQVFRLRPGADGDDRLELFFESTDENELFYGDNLIVAPNGHLIVCEDQYTDPVDNHLRGITPQGAAYPLARLKLQTELAGACFAPDGKTLFVNIFSPTMTVAITGPWRS
jgi:hypothetical protein